MMMVNLVFSLLSTNAQFIGINDNDIVTSVYIRCKFWFMLAS